MSGDPPVPSDETLLGYILGGLSDQENAQIEDLLALSEPLRIRLRDLRSMLEPLAHEQPDPDLDDDIAFHPPSGLVDSTLAAIEHRQQHAPEEVQAIAIANADVDLDSSRLPLPYFDSQLSPSETRSTRLAWFDSLATLAAGIVLLSLVLPGVLRWRETARQQECAENLRNLGSALGSFALFQPSHRLPAIDPNGPLAFVGVYSIRLQDNELLESKRWLQCPSDSSDSLLVSIPTSQQYIEAPESKRYVWRMLAGGDYAYHMGSIVEGKYQAPSIETPARVAWIGDALPVELDSHSIDQKFQLHGARGLNVLYSDGSVQWFKLPKLHELASVDHPYLNNALRQAPGLGEADACLGPGHLLPTVSPNRSVPSVLPD